MNDPYANELPPSMLGLECHNKTGNSQQANEIKDDKRRQKKVETNSQILARLEKQRKEQIKKLHRNIPESKAELLCKQAISSPKNDGQIDVDALVYSFQNFAHILYREKDSDELYAQKHPIEFNRKTIAQAIDDIKESCHKRQFVHESSVPEAQKASQMWARMFSILEKINSLESIFSQLRLLFHEEAHLCTFSCAKSCRDAKLQYIESLPVDRAANREHLEQCRRICVADSFFGQFYIPIGFIRRNAFFKETCVGNALCAEIPSKKIDEEPLEVLAPEEEEKRSFQPLTEQEQDAMPFIPDQTTNLMDVQFLSIFEIISLAMSSLEHLAALNPIPTKTIDNLIEEQDVEEPSEKARRKRDMLDKELLQTNLPKSLTYESAPEKMLYRCKEIDRLDVQSIVKKAFEARTKIARAEMNRKCDAFDLDRVTDEERAQRHVEMLENLKECISLQDGLHDRFSDERIEIYRIYPKTNGSSARYACYNTKKQQINDNYGNYDKATVAMRNFFPKEYAFLERKELLSEFDGFVDKNRQEMVGQQVFTFDEALVAHFFAAFLIRDDDEQWFSQLSDKIVEQLAANCTENLSSQIETPNYRAWSASVLEQLENWLKELESSVVKDTEYWSRFDFAQQPGNETTHRFTEYCNKVQKKLPWLFEKRDADSTSYLFQHRQMENGDDRKKSVQEQFIINSQFRANCTRIWNVDSALNYFNEHIFVQHDNFTDFDRKLQRCFSLRVKNSEILNLLESTRQIAIVQGQSKNTLWTVCCEPLLQGCKDFISNGENDPWCEHVIFSANQKRDFNKNPFVQFHSYIWRLFRGKWSSIEHKVLPEVAHIGARIVESFMRQQSIPVTACNDETYLLSDEFLSHQARVDSSRKVVAERLRKVLVEAEQYLPSQQVKVENNSIQLVEDFNENSLEVAQNNIFELIGYSSSFVHERTFDPPLHKFVRPYLSLNSLLTYNATRNAQKRALMGLPKLSLTIRVKTTCVEKSDDKERICGAKRVRSTENTVEAKDQITTRRSASSSTRSSKKIIRPEGISAAKLFADIGV